MRQQMMCVTSGAMSAATSVKAGEDVTWSQGRFGSSERAATYQSLQHMKRNETNSQPRMCYQ